MLNRSTQTILHLLMHKHAPCLIWFEKGEVIFDIMLHPQDSVVISKTQRQCFLFHHGL